MAEDALTVAYQFLGRAIMRNKIIFGLVIFSMAFSLRADIGLCEKIIQKGCLAPQTSLPDKSEKREVTAIAQEAPSWSDILKLLQSGRWQFEEAGAGGVIIDLHNHTTASDGKLSPSEKVKRAKQLGIEVMAVSDHNTIGGVAEAVEVGRQEGVLVIPSAEIVAGNCGDMKLESTEFQCPGVDIHVIQEFFKGVEETRIQWGRTCVDNIRRFLNSGPDALAAFNKALKEDQQLRDKMTQALNRYHSPEEVHAILDRCAYELNTDLSDKQLRFEYPSRDEDMKSVSTFRIYKFMLKEGIFKNTRLLDPESPEKIVHPKVCGVVFGIVFKKYFSTLQVPTQQEVISNILKAGGTPILCHPALVKGIRTSDFLDPADKHYTEKGIPPGEWIKALVGYGLKGIELYRYTDQGFNESEQNRINDYFLRLAKEHNLIWSYGSDDHYGDFIGNFGSKVVSVQKTGDPQPQELHVVEPKAEDEIESAK